MARPTKSSLDYFPHDTNARNDRKLRLLISETGMHGYGIFFALLEDAYNNSYYLPWTEEDKYLFVSEFNKPGYELTVDQVDSVISKACKWKLFDEKIFTDQQILTSAGLQKRYLRACERRTIAEIQKELLLINIEEFYQSELTTKTLSVKIVDKNGDTVSLYGDYEKPNNNNEVIVDKNEDNVDNNVDNTPKYDTKYDFDSVDKWDGKQPIDYSGCVDAWNKITGANSRVTESKRVDLRRVFRNYIGRECMDAMIVRSQDETLKKSKYLTDWSTLFGAKKLENLDKWVGRGREWTEKNNSMETVSDHKEAGWMNQRSFYDLCEECGVDPDNPIYCDVKKVEDQLLYYPKFNY